MPTHIALLRAVNLSGRNEVGMADLRGLLAELGMDDVRSLLQSGNLVFRSGKASTAQLERVLESATARRIGLETDFFVRTVAEWKAVIAGNRFQRRPFATPATSLVMFLKNAPARESATAALQDAIKGREAFRLKGRHAYIVYPEGIGRSRLTNALIEKKLGTRGTGRNWTPFSSSAAPLQVLDKRAESASPPRRLRQARTMSIPLPSYDFKGK